MKDMGGGLYSSLPWALLCHLAWRKQLPGADVGSDAALLV